MQTSEQRSKWLTVTYKKRRDKALELLGGKCVHCGTTENLEFDHINPADKRREMSQAFQCSKAKRDAEIAKCQLLCTPCHNKKSGKDHTKDFCKRGHAKTTENLYSWGACKACVPIVRKERKARKAQAKLDNKM